MDVRRYQRREKFDEWMQWLAERLVAVEERDGTEPAFRRYARLRL
jgi:hypothetical protein